MAKGNYKVKILRENKYYELIAEVNKSNNIEEKTEKLSEIIDILAYSRITDYKIILQFLKNESTRIVQIAIEILSNFKNDDVFNILKDYLDNSDDTLKILDCDAMFKIKEENTFKYLDKYNEDKVLKDLINEYEELYSEEEEI